MKQNIIELQYYEGNKIKRMKKNLFYFFFNFQKLGSGGSVKQKIKELWPRSQRKK